MSLLHNLTFLSSYTGAGTLVRMIFFNFGKIVVEQLECDEKVPISFKRQIYLNKVLQVFYSESLITLVTPLIWDFVIVNELILRRMIYYI